MNKHAKCKAHISVWLLALVVNVMASCLIYAAEGNGPQPPGSSAALKLQIVSGQPKRLPMGLGIVGQPPVAVIAVSAEEKPSAEFVLVGYRSGKEVSRRQVTLPEKPYSARIQLDEWPAEVALLGRAAPGAELVELARQALPEPEIVPWRPQSQTSKVQIAKTTEVLLSGSDWKLGSFPMGKGEAEHAYLPTFDDSKFHTVCVPGEVAIQMGFKGRGLYSQSTELTLLNEKEWWYRKAFVPSEENKGKIVRLLFEGANYFTTVWLNGEKLGESEGCFVPFSSFDISSKLHYGEANFLVVKVTCPYVPKDGRGFLEYMIGEWNFCLSFPGDANVLIASPPYRLSPALSLFPLGLFRDIKLVASGAIVVDDLFVQTKKLNPDGSATLTASGKILNQSDQDVVAKLEWKITPDNFLGEAVQLPVQSLKIHPGENRIDTQVVVEKPQLWWTWDTGPQNLYQLTASISQATGAASDTRTVGFGIRTIERHADMSYWLNGQRLFLKGAWYPVSDCFLSAVQRVDYEKDLELFKAANLNSLVLMGLVEKPDFFDLCDRLGILNFYEFPFSQFGPLEVVYPAAPNPKAGMIVQPVVSPRREIFIEESLRQLRQIMIQLRNHPSIIVWDAFAEVGDPAYGEYGNLIRQLVEELSPGTIYHPSFCDAGEHHFWEGNAGLPSWAGYQSQFDANAGFVSEYGSTALSVFQSLTKILPPEDIWSGHGRLHPGTLNLPADDPPYGYNLGSQIKHSLISQMHQFVDQQPRSLQEFIDDTQVYQAFIYKYATESYRRKKYHSINGTRIWSFKDLPSPGNLAAAASFNCVDYFHEPKMGYYSLKHAQERLSINFAYKEALESQPAGKQLNIPVWVINDFRRQVPVDVSCEIFDLKGQKLWGRDFTGTIESDGGKEIGVVEWVAPTRSGIYLLRGKASERGGTGLTAQNTIFIKVVSPAQLDVPVKRIVPLQEIVKSLRVLLIGQKLYSEPIAGWLTGMGVKVEVISEETIGRFGELRDAETIRANYDVVWLACFNSLWKLMDDDMAKGLTRAIAHGVGFIHTGGTGSFHGDDLDAALIDARPLADALPVKLRNRDDVIFDWFPNDKDIKLTVSPAKGWNGELKECGISGFNMVEVKPDSQQILTVDGCPLLVTGNYGQGRTVVFTGFTPTQGEIQKMLTEALQRSLKAGETSEATSRSERNSPDMVALSDDASPLGRGTPSPGLKSQEQKILPAPYATMFLRMLVEVGGEKVRNAYRQLAAQYQPPFTSSAPLFENLKDLPETTVQLPEAVELTATGRRAASTVEITNGGAYARLVRMRVEWDQPEGEAPYVMFSDNFIDLLPNENVSIAVDLLLPKENMGNVSGTLVVEGPNVETRRIPMHLVSRQREGP